MKMTSFTAADRAEKNIEQFVLDAGSDDLPTFGGSFEGGIHCQQIPDEIGPCIHAILGSGLDLRSYLEIGVAAGGTTFLFDHFSSRKRWCSWTTTSTTRPGCGRIF